MIEVKYGKRKVVKYRGAKMVVGGLTTKNKIDILLYISKEMANISEESELYERVISLSQEIFEVDNITLRLWDGKLLQPVAYLSEIKGKRRPLQFGEGFSGAVFASRQAALIQDLELHPEYLDDNETTRCVICVPVINRDEALGTLSIEKEISHFYKKDDMEILEAMASQLALALTNVKLIQGMMESRKRQQKIQEQLEWDLRMGRNVQNQIVPQKIPPWNSLGFAFYYSPMVEVSGDYFNVVRRADHLTAIIADVSGHGVPAALVTMALHYHFKLCMERGLGLLETLEELSESVRPILPDGVYFTAQIVRVYADHSFSFVNAGHCPLVHYRYEQRNFDELDTSGLPIGFARFIRDNYEEKFGQLSPGDILMMLTDGFTEQRNLEGEEVGAERLYRWLDEQRDEVDELADGGGMLEEIFRGTLASWRNFVGDTPIGDDLTLLVIQCNPREREGYEFYRRAKMKNTAGEYTEALELARKAYACDASLAANLLLLSKLSYRQEQMQEAANYLTQYIEICGEKNAPTHYMLGMILFRMGNIAGAKKAFKKALAADHTFSKAHLALARCYLREKAPPKALKVLQSGVKMAPADNRLKQAMEQVKRYAAI